MQLFRRHDYGLVEGRDDDRPRCGSAWMIIIVAVRRMGDEPILAAVCAASVQKNCHHSYLPLTAYLENNMETIFNYARHP
jgi:hypothetical protein